MKMAKRINFSLVELLTVISIIAVLSSLLVPAMRKTIRLSNNKVCKNNIKQIVTGTIIYSEDNNDYYPHDSNNMFRPNPQSIALLLPENWEDRSEHFDLRPLINPYFGDDLNGLFHCPLGPPSWTDNSIEQASDLNYQLIGGTPARMKIPYSLFFGNFETEISTSWTVTENMTRTGTRFTLGASAGKGEGRSFGIITADFLFRKTGHLKGTHPSPSNRSFQENEFTNSNLNWRTELPFETDANFGIDDGSVQYYKNLSAFDGYDDETRMFRTGRHDRTAFLLPVEFAK
jgi:type II secretory pathway pseudopilin PulG